VKCQSLWRAESFAVPGENAISPAVLDRRVHRAHLRGRTNIFFSEGSVVNIDLP
jgi:hypothetical protein